MLKKAPLKIIQHNAPERFIESGWFHLATGMCGWLDL
jgi:hypothetical protein